MLMTYLVKVGNYWRLFDHKWQAEKLDVKLIAVVYIKIFVFVIILETAQRSVKKVFLIND